MPGEELTRQEKIEAVMDFFGMDEEEATLMLIDSGDIEEED